MFTRLKTALFAPMPSASTATAAMLKPGDFQSWRKANRKSWIILARLLRSGERARLACWFRRHRRNDLAERRVQVQEKIKFATAMAPSPAREARALPRNCKRAIESSFGSQRLHWTDPGGAPRGEPRSD